MTQTQTPEERAREILEKYMYSEDITDYMIKAMLEFARTGEKEGDSINTKGKFKESDWDEAFGFSTPHPIKHVSYERRNFSHSNIPKRRKDIPENHNE